VKLTLVAGPLAWTVHELLGYFLAAFVCGPAFPLLFHAVSLACLAFAAIGAYAARRDSFMVYNGVFAFAIVLAWLPQVAVGPC
jgi:hypothetical protein